MPTLGVAQSAPSPGADPLRAVIFAGQDAVIDLGPIVPTPTASTPTASREAPPAPAADTAAPPRFTVTRIAADGSRQTQAIDAADLQALSRPGPPPSAAVRKAPAGERHVARAVAGLAPAPVVPASQRLSLHAGWTPAVSPDTEVAAASDAPDAVSQLEVRSQATPRKRPRDAAAFGVHDGRRYGEQGRFYIFAGGKGGGIGLNLIDQGERWGSDGFSWDRVGFVGQRSAGLGWRKGDVTTSLGWAHEKNRVRGFFGFPSEKDERVALNLTWRPSPK